MGIYQRRAVSDKALLARVTERNRGERRAGRARSRAPRGATPPRLYAVDFFSMTVRHQMTTGAET